MASTKLSWALLTLLKTALCAPSITYPINSQVPPVARIGQAFSFSFSQSTFTSSSGSSLSYTLADPPEWLSIDSDSRRLYGTPSDGDIEAGDVVGVPISLVASDDSGSTTLSATLVVSRNTGPSIQKPIADQISTFGAYSAPSSILSYPSKDFSFSFATDTFTDPSGSGLSYYAVTADNTPLPSWITFDDSKLAFSGQTPSFASLVQPPQTFSFQFIASDVVGFSAVSIGFSLVVGNHVLTVDDPSVELNATIGKALSYDGLQGAIKLDGNEATSTDVSTVSPQNLPSWLAFDQTTWKISGTPPESAQSTAFSIIFEDTFSDSLNVTFNVTIVNSAFKDTLPELNLKAGDSLKFDLKPYLYSTDDVDITADIKPQTSWINFDSDSLVLSGDSPGSATSSEVKITFNAESKYLDHIDSQSLELNILPSSVTSSISSTIASTQSATTTPTATSTSNATNTENKGHKQHVNTVLLAVLLPILLICLALIIILFCFCRRRKKRLSQSLRRRDISGPMPDSFVYNGAIDATSSLSELTKEYDIAQADAALGPGQPGYKQAAFQTLRRSQTAQDIPPVPRVSPVLHSGPLRSASDNVMPERRTSWLAPLRNIGKPLLQRSDSYLTDASYYDDDDSIVRDHPPTIILTHDRENSFRDGLEVNIPSIDGPSSAGPSSIQPTPEFAYSSHGDEGRHQGASDQFGRVYSAAAPSSEILLSPSRPMSRLGNYGPGTYDKRPSQPWIKGNPAKFLKSVTGSRKKNLSVSTIDTFEDKSKAKAAALPQMPPHAYTHLGGAEALDEEELSRPPSRKEGVLSPRFGHARKNASPRVGVDEDPRISQTIWPVRKSDFSQVSTGQNSEVPRDSLGISYEDLIRTSPFHPSKTWSTIHSGAEVQGSKTTTTDSNEPNWTVLEESPFPKDWRNRRSKDLLSPNKWREPLGTASSQRDTAGRSGIGHAVTWNTTQSSLHHDAQKENYSTHQGRGDSLSLSGSSRGDEDDYAVYI